MRVLAIAVFLVACKGSSESTVSDCPYLIRPASLWLAEQQLGVNDNSSGSDATKAFRDYSLAWRVEDAFEPWCTDRGKDVGDGSCFTTRAGDTACASLQTSLLAHRVSAKACARLVARQATTVLALEDVGKAPAFTAERMAQLTTATARYRTLPEHDAVRICDEVGGVRQACLAGDTGEDCVKLRAALRAAIAR